MDAAREEGQPHAPDTPPQRVKLLVQLQEVKDYRNKASAMAQNGGPNNCKKRDRM
jgi:hypothetical protein